MRTRCGKITINKAKKKLVECSKEANWESPQRIWVKGTLKVCDDCKKVMEIEYRNAGMGGEFTRLEIV